MGTTSVSPFVPWIPKYCTKILKTYAYIFAEIEVNSFKKL